MLGVFTSIPNLIRHGLESEVDLRHLRLTLTKLDSSDGAVASWFGPTFACLERDLTQFVETDEFSGEQCKALVAAIDSKRPVASIR